MISHVITSYSIHYTKLYDNRPFIVLIAKFVVVIAVCIFELFAVGVSNL